MREERKRKIHFLKLCSSSSGTNQKQVRQVGLLVVPEGGSKIKQSALKSDERGAWTAQKNGANTV